MSLYALYSETWMIEVQTKLEPMNFNLLNAGEHGSEGGASLPARYVLGSV